MCSGWNTVSEMSFVSNPQSQKSHAFCDESIVLWDLQASHVPVPALFQTHPELDLGIVLAAVQAVEVGAANPRNNRGPFTHTPTPAVRPEPTRTGAPENHYLVVSHNGRFGTAFTESGLRRPTMKPPAQ
jgi:hypothetical protein